MKVSEIRKSLRSLISGEVLWDKEILNFYSVDASLYRIIPKVVIIPNSEEDVALAVKFAEKNKIPITARGTGTGLVGSALNKGIIIDLKKLKSVIIKKKIAIIGPGVIKGELDKILAKEKKFFPPNPSIGPYCSMGGIIGNNASGSRTLKYGSTIDNLEEVTFVNGKGEKITLPKNQKYGKKILLISQRIEKTKFPKVSKNSCGYRLDCINSLKDTHKTLAGSEGTLGIIVSAKIKIFDIPQSRILFVVGYQSPQKAAEDCLKIKSTKPSAIEFVDNKTLENIDFKFKKNTNCLLFVEYDSDLNNIKNKFKNVVKGKIERSINTKNEIERWWKYRDLALSYSLKSIKQKDRVPHIIEDATVPLEKLGELFLIIEKINKKFHTDTVMYGHAGNGNIHVRIISCRKKLKILDKIARTYFEQILKLGGTITGEHGDGIARSGFIKNQYGPKNYYLFKKIKRTFDPHEILNPGKITSVKKFPSLEKV
ncbi:MAG: FAD-binding oxidoreductase [Nitrosopumilaceae archaeon]|jgi:FAD/FMN-containing dehydrogenase